jgi:hypothetical protein
LHIAEPKVFGECGGHLSCFVAEKVSGEVRVIIGVGRFRIMKHILCNGLGYSIRKKIIIFSAQAP